MHFDFSASIRLMAFGMPDGSMNSSFTASFTRRADVGHGADAAPVVPKSMMTSQACHRMGDKVGLSSGRSVPP